MTTDEIIEVLQGVKAGRKWEIHRESTDTWRPNVEQSFGALMSMVATGYTVRLAPLPDEITLPARTIPAPLREAPKDAEIVFLADPFEDGGYTEVYFYKRDAYHESWLKRGFFFATAEKAAKASKAMEPYAA